METVSMLVIVLFVSGALAGCSDNTALSINASKKLEALSGSCLQIPCSFTPKAGQTFDSTRKTFGVWIKNQSQFGNNKGNVIFNSSGAVSTSPMSITGNLSQKDCTTLFSNLTTTYTNTYFFRVESEPFKATAACDPLQITVRDSPWRPKITIPGDLKEKESVTITCSALTPCPHSPPQLTWNLQQDSHNKIEQNTDGSFTTKIQQTITLSDTHDGKKISCSARYPVNQGKDTKTAETEETLSVSYVPKDTSASISPSGLVSAGSWVKLTCSSRAKPPVSSFTWFKKSRDGAVKVSEGEIYSFNVTDGGVYYCVATNDLGNQTSAEIHVTVADAPKDTSASISPSGLVSAGSWVKLTCSSRAKPPVSSFTWFKKSRDGAVKVSEGEIYSFNVTDGGVYYCVATNDLGNQTSGGIHVTVAESTLVLLLGGISGIILLICLIIFLWWSKSMRRTQQQTRIQPHEERVVEGPANNTEKEEENIHYGEISFSKLGFESPSDSVQDRGEQQDTVYAQVKVNKQENSLTQRAHGQEELYAEVKKK
ncbi:B-cell receptor CD22-like isoform X1 [Oreochromis aureus]|uniref:B-cell receptor CD22-like isoform X1 n=1 Tax=Oreochromis aureus TaxID=47969 RepID=UPI0019541B01|nr:B-cell receptor CD22-like isoform X1 [Oreochromis aureus]